MNKKRLTKLLEHIPSEAIVYICSGHGQMSEVSGDYISVTNDINLDYYGEDIHWVNMPKLNADDITAILIS